MDKRYIKIIVEGNEEEAFFDVVKQVGTHKDIIVEIENAGGFGEVADLFLESIREELYDCVFCVYDVDNKSMDPKAPFNQVRCMLISILGNEHAVELVSFCTNPNILQLFLLAADRLSNVSLTSSSKKNNSELVHRYWNDIASSKSDEKGHQIKSHYDASDWQLEIMKYTIINNEYRYDDLLERMNGLPSDYKNNVPSSNLLSLLVAIKNGDFDYFDRIRNELDDIDKNTD